MTTQHLSPLTMLLSRHTRRREFITLLGGAAVACPLAARAQQAAMPVIGFLDLRSPEALMDRLRGFRAGLREAGYVEGDNVTVAYRWAENKIDRVPELAAELVRRQVAVMLVAGSTGAVFSAKAATSTIPILFIVPQDPVRLGLVTSLARLGRFSSGRRLRGPHPQRREARRAAGRAGVEVRACRQPPDREDSRSASPR